MLYIIILLLVIWGFKKLVSYLLDFDCMDFITTLVIGMLGAIICFGVIPNKTAEYAELEAQYVVEDMDKNSVTIKGTKYDYELKYAEDAEAPYATIVEVTYPKWHQVLMVFKTNKTIAYVYTNDVAAINDN